MFDLEEWSSKVDKKEDSLTDAIVDCEETYLFNPTKYSEKEELLYAVFHKAMRLNNLYYIEVHPDCVIFKYRRDSNETD